MRKLILFFTALFLVLAAGCGTNGDLNVATTPPSSPTPACEEIIQLVSTADWGPVTLERMAVSVDTIIVGKVAEVLPAVRVNLSEYGYETSSDREEWANITRCRVEVLTSVKGQLTEGETINVDQRGGLAECINEYTEDLPFLMEDTEYVLFLYEPGYGKDLLYCRYMTGAWQSYLEVVDGKMIEQEYSFFEEGLPLEDAVEQIKAVMISIPPVNIPIEQAVQALSDFLTNYETELGFAPKRDLTYEELAQIHDFEADSFIKEVKGLELENGRIVIWVKTDELNKGQQNDFEQELGSSIKLYADSLGVDYKVTVTQLDTLITIIGGGECRADIHDWFSDYIKRDGRQRSQG